MKIYVYKETREKAFKSLINRIQYFCRENANKVNLIYVSKDKITKLNKKFRGLNAPTDVLSFENQNKEIKNYLGDVYICPEVIRNNSKKFKVRYEEELTRIIIHGILHLLGYNHKKDFGESDEEMFRIQEEIVEKVLESR